MISLPLLAASIARWNSTWDNLLLVCFLGLQWREKKMFDDNLQQEQKKIRVYFDIFGRNIYREIDFKIEFCDIFSLHSCHIAEKKEVLVGDKGILSAKESFKFDFKTISKVNKLTSPLTRDIRVGVDWELFFPSLLLYSSDWHRHRRRLSVNRWYRHKYLVSIFSRHVEFRQRSSRQHEERKKNGKIKA